MAAVLLAAIFLSLFIGAGKVSFESEAGRAIFWKIRMPRTVLVLVSGALLAGCGAAYQLFFRNGLAEPGIMGVTSGATLGAVVALTLTAGIGNRIAFRTGLMNVGAFVGAIGSGAVVVLLSSRKRGSGQTAVILLCGVALGTLYSSLTSILFSVYGEKLRNSIFSWMMGSFSGKGWTEVKFILVLAVACVGLLFTACGKLDLLIGGESSAENLGLNVAGLRTLVLVAGALGTSAAVCAGGTIGFVGLIAPHVVRNFVGSKAVKLVPFSMAAGSILLLVSDVIARVVVAPAELAVGIITSILGVPFFVSLVAGKRGMKNE